MEEIKVGEYIRSDNGIILKYEYLKKHENEILLGQKGKSWSFEDEEEFEDFIQQRIVKHSPNIIDLIEEGDYVNEKKINAIIDGFLKSDGVAERVLCFETDFPIEKGLRCYHNCDIKSIVTKEQFKSVEYIVKEEQ